jgi:SAM-dependent methyltransferase
MSAIERWRRDLEAWAIPETILAQAEESPWIHPPVLFEVPASIEPTPSHQRAGEVLVEGASLLDVGCGGGIAAMAQSARVRRVIGVDHQPEMLAMFARNARERALEFETVEGFWPAVAGATPVADVVTAHHVLYNVGDVAPFVRALDDHARLRVVLELPTQHPLSNMSGAWEFFWGLERPTTPTSDDLIDVLSELDIHASHEIWQGVMRAEIDLDQAAHFTRIRLCLPSSRESDVRDFLAAQPVATTRSLATVWWDK